jgi:hypothetical protein
MSSPIVSCVVVSSNKIHVRNVPYRKYILPLFPTFATVNCRPSRPAEFPSGATSFRMPSTSLFARRLMLFSLRNPSWICFFLSASADRLTAAGFVLGAGDSFTPDGFGTASTSLTLVEILLMGFANRPRGERRSRCRCRRLSGECILAGW